MFQIQEDCTQPPAASLIGSPLNSNSLTWAGILFGLHNKQQHEDVYGHLQDIWQQHLTLTNQRVIGLTGSFHGKLFYHT